MADSRLVKEWLAKANEDLNFAKINLKELSHPFFSQICFHLQQAAEKYFKAYIVSNGLEFKKIHDLTILLKICSRQNIAFLGLEEEAGFLTDYYIDTRYPVHWPAEISKKEANEALECAERIRDFIIEQLGL
jgi:HEPN domain-containing protein